VIMKDLRREIYIEFLEREADGVRRSVAEKLELCRRNLELAEMVRKLANAASYAEVELRDWRIREATDCNTSPGWQSEAEKLIEDALNQVPDEFKEGK
jgi:hypothetical protein